MFENSPLAELAIGRSTVRQRILALLILEPGQRLHLREIQRRAGTSPGTASRELGKLLAAGLVEREAEGVQVYFRAADNPIAAMMRQLLLLQTDAPVLPRPSALPRPRRVRPIAADVVATGRAPVDTPAGQATSAAGPVDRPTADAADPAEKPPLPDHASVGSAGGATANATVAASIQTPDPLGLLIGARFAAAIRPLYEARLKGVYLFGIRALGPAPEEADVELLVVLDRVESYGEELERTSVACAQLSLELGLVVSRVFTEHGSWTGPVHGFAAVISDEDDA